MLNCAKSVNKSAFQAGYLWGWVSVVIKNQLTVAAVRFLRRLFLWLTYLPFVSVSMYLYLVLAAFVSAATHVAAAAAAAIVRKLWHTSLASGLWPCRLDVPQDVSRVGGRGEVCSMLDAYHTMYDYLLPASCPLMWLPVSPRAENSDGCSFTSISLRRLFNLFVCMNRKNVHDIASSAISSTELQEREREGEGGIIETLLVKGRPSLSAKRTPFI